MAVYEQIYGSSPFSPDTDMDGWIVSSIDRRPAVETIRNLDVSTSKDAGSRFNLAVNGYGDTKGYFAWRPIGRFGIPEKEFMVLGLVNPASIDADAKEEEVALRWLGIYQAASADVVAALAKEVPERVQDEQSRPDEIVIRNRLHERFSGHIFASMFKGISPPSLPIVTRPIHGLGSIPAPHSSGVAYGDYGDGVGILKISTFSPDITSTFRYRIEEAMLNFTAAGNSKLILDLRANGGGSICLGYAVKCVVAVASSTSFPLCTLSLNPLHFSPRLSIIVPTVKT